MAAACDCGAKKNHAIHVVALGMPGAHKYRNPSRAGMSPIGADREEYLKSDAHKEAYARAGEQPFCLAHMAGAPDKCSGPLTKHHVFARSAAGGQEQAEDGWPVILVCQGFNGDVESKPKVRAWAERNTFVWHVDGKEYPFRISAVMARRLKPAKESA